MHHIPTNESGRISTDFTPPSPQQSSAKSIIIPPKPLDRERADRSEIKIPTQFKIKYSIKNQGC